MGDCRECSSGGSNKHVVAISRDHSWQECLYAMQNSGDVNFKCCAKIALRGIENCLAPNDPSVGSKDLGVPKFGDNFLVNTIDAFK